MHPPEGENFILICENGEEFSGNMTDFMVHLEMTYTYYTNIEPVLIEDSHDIKGFKITYLTRDFKCYEDFWKVEREEKTTVKENDKNTI